MKTRHDIIYSLQQALNDAKEGPVTIPNEDARWLLDFLLYPQVESQPVQQEGDSQLFYCAQCAKSFWYRGEEDGEIRKKYGYSVWYAPCPFCGAKIRQTDRYWR